MRILNYRWTITIAALALAAFVSGMQCEASVIGMNPPTQSLTRDRVMTLPSAERAAWLDYLQRSEQQRKVDKDTLAAELKRSGMKAPIEPPHGSAARSIPLDRERGWYAGADAAHIADVIVSYQTPAGGWGKNLDMSKSPRQPGERYGPDNRSNFLGPNDFDTPADPEWDYIGTIDNDATTTQLAFLAKVIAAVGAARVAGYRAPFQRGMEYLLAAQYPNGGWPQVWPLEGGYHDAITYNDDAMKHVLELMDQVAQGEGEFVFVPEKLRRRAATSFARGVQCILASQIKSDGALTAWAQQVDALTLRPVSARNYEMPALSSGESAGILLLLMDDLPHPSAAQVHAVYAGIAWLRETAIYRKSWQSTPEGRGLVAEGAGPLWARYYQPGTNKPIFGDRDKTIHDDVKEISQERRNGYAWYSAGAQQVLDRFKIWSQQHSESQ